MIDWTITNLLLCLVSVSVFSVAYNYLMKAPWSRLPPGPLALPLVGSLPFLGKDVREPLFKMGKRYGGIFTIYLGRTRVVVLTGLDVLKEAYVKNAKIFVDRPHTPSFDMFSKGCGFLLTNGPVWKEQRQHCLYTLKTLGENVIEERIYEELEHCVDELRKHTGTPYNPMSLIHASVANVIVSVMCGRRYQYSDPNFHSYMRTAHHAFELFDASGLLIPFPFLKYLPGDIGGLKEMDANLREVHAVHQKWIDEQKTHFSDKCDREEPPTNFIESYLQKMKSSANNPNSVFNEKQLLGVLCDLFSAGSDTTYVTICWSIIFMVLNPKVQSRVQTEIDDVINKGTMPMMSHQRRLPYVEACIHEVQRLADIVPFTIRAAADDVTIKGYHIPKGTTIYSSWNSLHSDPSVWHEPKQFCPDRFLDGDGEVVRNENLVPFGFGKRQCPGEELARMELFLFFTAIMKNFKFSPAPGHPLPDINGDFVFLHTPKPFHITMEARG